MGEAPIDHLSTRTGAQCMWQFDAHAVFPPGACVTWRALPCQTCQTNQQKLAGQRRIPHVYIYIYISIHTLYFLHVCVHIHAYITLHCITLHYTTLHYVTLHYIAERGEREREIDGWMDR